MAAKIPEIAGLASAAAMLLISARPASSYDETVINAHWLSGRRSLREAEIRRAKGDQQGYDGQEPTIHTPPSA